jgi:hypothetical protein
MQRSFSFSLSFLTPTVPGLDVFFRFKQGLASWRYSKGCDRGREFQKQIDSSAESSRMRRKPAQSLQFGRATDRLVSQKP